MCNALGKFRAVLACNDGLLRGKTETNKSGVKNQDQQAHATAFEQIHCLHGVLLVTIRCNVAVQLSQHCQRAADRDNCTGCDTDKADAEDGLADADVHFFTGCGNDRSHNTIRPLIHLAYTGWRDSVLFFTQLWLWYHLKNQPHPPREKRKTGLIL